MSLIFKIISVLTILIGSFVAFSGPISQTGIIDWSTAFKLMQKLAPLLMIGAGLSLIGLIFAIFKKVPGLALPSLLAIIIAGSVMASLMTMRSTAGEHPIHDITTDFANPPAIIAGAKFDRKNPANYVGDQDSGNGSTVREVQQKIYPDLAPQTFTQGQTIVFDAARASALAQGWEILSEDNVAGMIEATHKSRWFGFIDDISIRIAPVENGTRVDVRSKSRVGRSDLGANVKRIRAFQADLQERL